MLHIHWASSENRQPPHETRTQMLQLLHSILISSALTASSTQGLLQIAQRNMNG